MSEQPTPDASSSTPPAQTVPTAPTAPAAPPVPPAAAQATGKRTALLKRIGGAAIALVLVFTVRTLTADDGTHDIKVGECVAAVGSDDFTKTDCSSSDALGTVTFIDTDAADTGESAALALCEKHGAQGAFTSASTSGGHGAVICVADAH